MEAVYEARGEHFFRTPDINRKTATHLQKHVFASGSYKQPNIDKINKFNIISQVI